MAKAFLDLTYPEADLIVKLLETYVSVGRKMHLGDHSDEVAQDALKKFEIARKPFVKC